MKQEEPEGVPAEVGSEQAVPAEIEGERAVPATLEELRQVRPGFCPRCDAAVPADARFCPSCRTYVAAPDLGRLATPGRRLAAAILDGMFKDGGILGSLLSPFILRSGLGIGLFGVIVTLYWVIALFLWSRGTTPAKSMLRMTVVTEDGEPAGFFRMAFRETVGKWISTVVLGLGLLAIPYDRERRGWHDKLFDTWVMVDEEA